MPLRRLMVHLRVRHESLPGAGRRGRRKNTEHGVVFLLPGKARRSGASGGFGGPSPPRAGPPFLARLGEAEGVSLLPAGPLPAVTVRPALQRAALAAAHGAL